MSRMNAAWSNSEQWTEAIPEIFRQPMTIAFGGAVLAHAIFFLGLPILAGKDNQPSIVDTPVVELRPQDLSQIPPDATQSKFPTGTLMPSSTTGLLTPSILSPSTPPPLDSGTTFTPGIFTPGINFGSSDSSSSSTSIYPDRSSSIVNSGNILSLEAERKKLELEIAKKVAAKQVEDQKLADNARPNKPIGNLPSITPMPPSGETGKPASPPSTPATTLSTSTPRLSNQEIIAANPKNYDFDLKQTGPTIGYGLQQAIGKWQTKPDSKENEIYNSWQKPPLQLEVDTPTKTIPYPVQVNKQPVAVISDYAQKVKDGKETNGQAIVGIALDGQGKFVSEPSIIQSTGYPVLDAYAIEYVKSRMFRVTGHSGLYIMVIPIDPPPTKPVS